MKPWKDIYRLVHPGVDPSWKSLNDAKEWARNESKIVEPILLQVLRSEVDNVPWTFGLWVAREIPTTEVRNVLFTLLQDTSNRNPDGCFAQNNSDAGIASSILEILSETGDNRVVPFATNWALKDCQVNLVLERSIESIQATGDESSIAVIRAVPLRQKDNHIDRLCIMAERVIRARSEKRDLFENTEGELRPLLARFRMAVESKNVRDYISCFSSSRQEASDEAEIKAEVFDESNDVERVSMIEAFKQSAADPIEIDRKNLTATLVARGQFKVVFVLEADGWKIDNVLRVAP